MTSVGRCLVALCLLCASRAAADPSARFADLPAPTASSPRPTAQLSHVPASTTACPRSWDQLERARSLMAKGQVLFAIAEYTRTVSTDHRCFPALLELADIRARLGDYREAERLFEQALRVDAAADQALTQRAAMHHKRGQVGAALADLQAYVARSPQAVQRIEKLAAFYVDLKAWSAALASFRRIVVLLTAKGGPEGALEHARLQVVALQLLAAETDPVNAGSDGESGWVRAAMARLSPRQGARQLAP